MMKSDQTFTNIYCSRRAGGPERREHVEAMRPHAHGLSLFTCTRVVRGQRSNQNRSARGGGVGGMLTTETKDLDKSSEQ